MLLHVSQHTNLIARSTIPNLWTRHIADSLQLLPLAPDAKCWIDLGSGAGFPGLVIACALADRAGPRSIWSRATAKKPRSCAKPSMRLKVPAVVHAVRIEDFVKNFRATPDVV